DVRIGAGESNRKPRHALRSRRGEIRRVGVERLGHARELRRLLGHSAGVVTRDERVDVAADLLRRAHDVRGGGLERAVVVFGDDQRGHEIPLASLRSFATSSFASTTLPPPLRFGGSATLSVTSRGDTSTPSASGLTTSSGFFLAFMMLGSVA